MNQLKANKSRFTTGNVKFNFWGADMALLMLQANVSAGQIYKYSLHLPQASIEEE